MVRTTRQSVERAKLGLSVNGNVNDEIPKPRRGRKRTIPVEVPVFNGDEKENVDPHTIPVKKAKKKKATKAQIAAEKKSDAVNQLKDFGTNFDDYSNETKKKIRNQIQGNYKDLHQCNAFDDIGSKVMKYLFNQDFIDKMNQCEMLNNLTRWVEFKIIERAVTFRDMIQCLDFKQIPYAFCDQLIQSKRLFEIPEVGYFFYQTLMIQWKVLEEAAKINNQNTQLLNDNAAAQRALVFEQH
uniref:BACK domain-containing protein n=1 Tax=Rhabditophanes sp. KR3021 TaxID=114890 RepID=A0AC35TW37_9BILA